jgi:hypothetical protein
MLSNPMPMLNFDLNQASLYSAFLWAQRWKCIAEGILADKGANTIPDQGVLLVQKWQERLTIAVPSWHRARRRRALGRPKLCPTRLTPRLGPLQAPTRCRPCQNRLKGAAWTSLT